MMAEKTRLFEDHRAVELIMSSPSPSTRNASVAVYTTLTPVLGTRKSRTPTCLAPAGDKEKQNADLSGTYAKFTQNPAIKKSPFEL